MPFLRGADPVGVRLINCTESRVTLARLETGLGLGVLDAVIGRTELIVEVARRDRDRARGEVDQALVRRPSGELKGLAGQFVGSSRVLRSRVSAMRAQGLSDQQIRGWLEGVKKLEEIEGGWEKVLTAGHVSEWAESTGISPHNVVTV